MCWRFLLITIVAIAVAIAMDIIVMYIINSIDVSLVLGEVALKSMITL